MAMETRPANVLTLGQVLGVATQHGFAVGSFAARYTPMIRAIMRAAQRTQSPAIVQISQKELARCGIAIKEVTAGFYAALREESITVPLVLHLDHTRDTALIDEAIHEAYTSVMIDASEQPFDANVEITARVVAAAHAADVSVEAELGRIGTTDFVETDDDEELYTDPDEAGQFVHRTGVDALAVSVGTAHGVYTVRQPRIDLERLRAIRARTTVPLVLHGGSGVPSSMMHGAIQLAGGGVSKVNIATDLEVAFLAALGREERPRNSTVLSLPPDRLEAALMAVEAVVVEKIRDFVLSADQAEKFELGMNRSDNAVTEGAGKGK